MAADEVGKQAESDGTASAPNGEAAEGEANSDLDAAIDELRDTLKSAPDEQRAANEPKRDLPQMMDFGDFPLPPPPSFEEEEKTHNFGETAGFSSLDPDQIQRDRFEGKLAMLLMNTVPEDPLKNGDLIGDYALLALQLETSGNESFYKIAALGLDCLRYKQHIAARRIFSDLHYRTSVSASLTQVMRGVFITIGGFVFLCYLALFLVMFDVVAKFGLDIYKNIAVAVCFGFLGSVVSILESDSKSLQ